MTEGDPCYILKDDYSAVKDWFTANPNDAVLRGRISRWLWEDLRCHHELVAGAPVPGNRLIDLKTTVVPGTNVAVMWLPDHDERDILIVAIA